MRRFRALKSARGHKKTWVGMSNVRRYTTAPEVPPKYATGSVNAVAENSTAVKTPCCSTRPAACAQAGIRQTARCARADGAYPVIPLVCSTPHAHDGGDLLYAGQTAADHGCGYVWRRGRMPKHSYHGTRRTDVPPNDGSAHHGVLSVAKMRPIRECSGVPGAGHCSRRWHGDRVVGNDHNHPQVIAIRASPRPWQAQRRNHVLRQ